MLDLAQALHEVGVGRFGKPDLFGELGLPCRGGGLGEQPNANLGAGAPADLRLARLQRERIADIDPVGQACAFRQDQPRALRADVPDRAFDRLIELGCLDLAVHQATRPVLMSRFAHAGVLFGS